MHLANLLIFSHFIMGFDGLVSSPESSGFEPENHEKVLGAFTELVNSSLFYQTYLPLILKFRVPDWNVENLRLNKSLHCETDEISPTTSNLCPIAYHFEGLLTPLSQTMRFYKNVFSPPGGDFYEKNFSCDKIKPHFLHFSAQLGGLIPYLNEFRNRCPLGKNATLTVKTLAASASSHAVMAYEKFKQLHDDSVKDYNGSEWKFLDMTNYAAFQNSYIFSNYVESVRWANAFTACQAYRLDVGLVSPAMLNESLTDFSKGLLGTGYTFSLPFLSSLPHYYKIPLVDCIITLSNFPSLPGFTGFVKGDSSESNTTSNLIVRLLIPVVKVGVTHRIIKLNKIPYTRRDNGEDKICEISNFQPEDVYLVEQNDTTKVDEIIGRVSPFCLTSKLCKVPEITHRQVVDPCVTGVITKNHTLTAQHCFFECSALSGTITTREKVLPIFTQISSNRFAVTGLAPETLPLLFIQCHGQTTHMFKPHTNEGVIFVTLPCSCELAHGSKKFSVQEPCDDPILVEHVTEFGTRHRHDNDSIVHEDAYDSIDYAVEPLDAKEFNITFTETTTTKSTTGSEGETAKEKQTTEGSTTSSPPTGSVGPDLPHETQLHCGHVVLWMFLIVVLLLNFVSFMILYQNQLINIPFLKIGTSSGISRLENDIPIGNMSSGTNPI